MQTEPPVPTDYTDGKVRVEDLYAKPFSDENEKKPEEK